MLRHIINFIHRKYHYALAPLLILTSFLWHEAVATNYLDEMDDDFGIGQKDAPIKIIEYSAITCPHCAEFHNKVLPYIKKKFIDTGHVRFVHRTTFHPEDVIALRVSMIPLCAPKEKYHTFLSALMKTQKNWLFESSKHLDVASDVAKLGGMSKKDITACFKNKIIEDKLFNSQLIAVNKLEISATPTFIINKIIYRGFLTKNSLNKIIEDMLSTPKATPQKS